MKKTILQLSLIILSSQVFAQTTVENFSYGTTVDTLTNPTKGGASWVRHSGTGGPIDYLNTSLSFTGYGSSGIGGSAGFTFATTSREDANRPCTSYNTGSVYTSFLFNITNAGGTTGDYFFHLLDRDSMTQFRGRFFIKTGSVANTFNIGINKGTTSGVIYSSTDYPINTTILAVIKYTFSPGTFNDTVRAYIFPGTIPTTEPSVATIIAPDATTPDLARLNGIAIRQGTVGTMTGIIDGIRVADSWANSPLPVTLTSFTAKIVNDYSTVLSWTTSSEYDNMGFEVERSLDGNKFEMIGFVKGAGNSNKQINYSFSDANAGSAFYRLKQLDFDGKFSYSDIVSVKSDETETRFSPNPFDDQIQISSEGLIHKIEIVDMMGKVVLNEVLNSNSANVNSSNIVNGVYFIKIYEGESVITKRIIKAN